MKIRIKATNLELTPAIEEYIETKIESLGRLMKRFKDRGVPKMEVEIARTTKHHKKGDVFYAEINLYLPGKDLRAEYSASDIQAAIDKVKDKLKIEIERYKEKKTETRK